MVDISAGVSALHTIVRGFLPGKSSHFNTCSLEAAQV
jgi:hypothetical protein